MTFTDTMALFKVP